MHAAAHLSRPRTSSCRGEQHPGSWPPADADNPAAVTRPARMLAEHGDLDGPRARADASDRHAARTPLHDRIRGNGPLSLITWAYLV